MFQGLRDSHIYFWAMLIIPQSSFVGFDGQLRSYGLLSPMMREQGLFLKRRRKKKKKELVALSCPTLCTHQAPWSMEFSRQEYWVGCHALLQRIFLTQGWNPGLPHYHGCSSKAQPLLLTLEEGHLLTAAPPDLEGEVAPLGPPEPVQPLLLGSGVAPLSHRP